MLIPLLTYLAPSAVTCSELAACEYSCILPGSSAPRSTNTLMTSTIPGARIAIVGCGAAGLAAAYLLAKDETTSVTLYEQHGQLGGHANTVEVSTGDEYPGVR